MSDSTIQNSDGEPMGRTFAIDPSRVNAVGSRMIRAFYFIETKNALSPDVRINVQAKVGISPHDPDAIELAKIFLPAHNKKSRSIGKSFSYVAVIEKEFSMWALMLYGLCIWLGTTETEREDVEAEALKSR